MKRKRRIISTGFLTMTGYLLAVTYVCLILCEQTIWATSYWVPEQVNAERWGTTINKVNLVSDGNAWFAHTSSGYVSYYQEGTQAPSALMNSHEYEDHKSYVEALLHAAKDENVDHWQAISLTGQVKHASYVVTKSANHVCLSVVNHSLQASKNIQGHASLQCYHQQKEEQIWSLNWASETRTIHDLISVSEQSLLVVYDRCVELINWDEAGKIQRNELPFAAPYAVEYNPSLQQLFVVHNEKCLSCYSLKSLSIEWEIDTQTFMRVSDLVFKPETSTLYASYPDGQILTYDTANGDLQNSFLHGHTGVSHMVLKSEEEMLVCYFDGEIHQVALEDGESRLIYRVPTSDNDED